MKVDFIGDFVIRPVRIDDPRFPGGKLVRNIWRVGEYAIAWTGPDGHRYTLIIPDQYITDFASIPQPFHFLLHPMDSRIAQIAPGHDRAYETHEVIMLKEGNQIHSPFSRRDADLLLYHGMIALGAPRWQARLVYRAVRIGGRFAYSSGPTRQRVRMNISAHPFLQEVPPGRQ